MRMLPPLPSRKVSAHHRLTVLYVVTLGAIALLAIPGQVLVQGMLDRQLAEAAVVQRGERAHELSHALTQAAIGVQIAGNSPARAGRLEDLRRAAAAWERGYWELRRGEVAAADLELLTSLQPAYDEIGRASRLVLAADVDDGSTGAAVGVLLAEEAKFLTGITGLLDRYATQTAARVQEVKRVVFWVFVFRILLLCVVGAFVFRPAVGRVSDAVARLERTHDALTKSEASKAAILEAALDGIVTIDGEERIVEFNPGAERMFGFARADAIGRHLSDLIISPAARETYRAILAHYLTGRDQPRSRQDFELNARRADDSELIAEFAIARIDQDDVPLFACFMRDITSRRQAEQALATEAQIGGALALVGRELIASLNSADLLDRLCRLTTEVIGCDFSHTWLWQPEEEVTVAVAGYGDSPEQWDALRLLRLPRSAAASAVVDDVWQIIPSEGAEEIAVPIATYYGITRALYIPLRRGGEVIGGQSVGDRGRTGPFTEAQLRIARGIGQVASMALSHVNLLRELERTNRIKSNFVATMSHELRRSLGTIIGYIDLLLNGEFGSLTAEGAETLRKVAKGGWESLEVIKATLDLSRYEVKPIPLEVQDVAVATLFDEIATDTRIDCDNPDVQMVWQLPVDSLRLCTDPVKLKMVLNNLIANARKFTKAGRVTVSAGAAGGGVEFVVADTGSGIPPEAQAWIFEPFQQVEASRGRRHGGVGLGLYIVRRLVDLLGGTITLNSEMGRGATFRVWLPSAVADAG